tara:strand:- start:213 stop:689 length:477 start_codon:yes stop_codon:yes gene_type:complete
MKNLTHIDEDGNATMVDVSHKNETFRVAVAKGNLCLEKETIVAIMHQGVKKGDVMSVAQLAGIMGAKKTAELIPLCHPLQLNSVAVELECLIDRNEIEITATCKVSGRTGVEMEALTAVSISALTIYDMCKSIDRKMRINNVRLTHKSGGKSGTFEAK